MWYLNGNKGNVIRSNIHSTTQMLEEMRQENSRHGSLITVLNISGHGLANGAGVSFSSGKGFDIGQSYNQLGPYLAANAVIKIWSCEAANTYQKCQDLRNAANALDATIYANTGTVLSGPNGNVLSRVSRQVVAWVVGENAGEWRVFTPQPKIQAKDFVPGPKAFKIITEERPLR